MLVSSWSLLFREPVAFLVMLALHTVALVAAITVHEFSHAAVATALGDATARRRGRLSLNPLRHLDPLGTLMLYVVGFGWGRPVPVQPAYLRLGPRVGMAAVAAAGPLSNLATVALLALPMRLGWLVLMAPHTYVGGEPLLLLSQLVSIAVIYNLVLAVFNLLPLAPLDGFSVVLGVLPPAAARGFARLGAYGPAILILTIVVDNFAHTSILWSVLGPAINLASSVLLGVRIA